MLRPLGRNVIVSVREGDKKTSSGLLLAASLDPDKGIVEAVGSEVTEVKAGEVVFLDWNKALKIDNEEFYLINVDNIVFVYEDE